MGRKLLDKARGPQHILTFTSPSILSMYAEIMELYYSGDKIGYRRLSKQFGFTPSMFKKIVAKYYPKVGTRDTVILIQSKINDMWGPEDVTDEEAQNELHPKQEDLEE